MFELTRITFEKYTYKSIYSVTYQYFTDYLKNKKLFFAPYGIPIIISTVSKLNLIDGKEPLFWHLISFDEEKHNKYFTQEYPPCINTEYQNFCNECNSTTAKPLSINGKKRYRCAFRASYMQAIIDLINQCNILYSPESDNQGKNSDNNSIKVWHDENPEKPFELLVYILYSKKGVRYLILLSTINKKSELIFITAYPIFEGSIYSTYNEKYRKAKAEKRIKLGP